MRERDRVGAGRGVVDRLGRDRVVAREHEKRKEGDERQLERATEGIDSGEYGAHVVLRAVHEGGVFTMFCLPSGRCRLPSDSVEMLYKLTRRKRAKDATNRCVASGHQTGDCLVVAICKTSPPAHIRRNPARKNSRLSVSSACGGVQGSPCEARAPRDAYAPPSKPSRGREALSPSSTPCPLGCASWRRLVPVLGPRTWAFELDHNAAERQFANVLHRVNHCRVEADAVRSRSRMTSASPSGHCCRRVRLSWITTR